MSIHILQFQISLLSILHAFYLQALIWWPCHWPLPKNIYLYLHLYLYHLWASLVAQLVKNPPAVRETWIWSLGWENPLENGMATHSSILAGRIPWTIYSSWGRRESDTTEWLSLFTFITSVYLSCPHIGVLPVLHKVYEQCNAYSSTYWESWHSPLSFKVTFFFFFYIHIAS